jgi:hypothetical protein
LEIYDAKPTAKHWEVQVVVVATDTMSVAAVSREKNRRIWLLKSPILSKAAIYGRKAI